MSGQGHNLALDKLRAFVERIERIEEEQKALAADKGEIYKEAKEDGFDTKVLRIIVQRRKMDAAERAERDALVELYEGGLGG